MVILDILNVIGVVFIASVVLGFITILVIFVAVVFIVIFIDIFIVMAIPGGRSKRAR